MEEVTIDHIQVHANRWRVFHDLWSGGCKDLLRRKHRGNHELMTLKERKGLSIHTTKNSQIAKHIRTEPRIEPGTFYSLVSLTLIFTSYKITLH